MKNHLFAGILLIICVLGLNAQNDTIMIDEVEINSKRASELYNESSRVIHIISKEEINNAPVQSLAELLEYALNVDVRQRGNHGVQADISIRGGSFEQTLILINGVKVNDPQTGHHNLNLPLDMENIERIEILEGPGSRIYGPNAFSGAVNIITGGDKENSIKLSTTVGEYNFFKASVATSYKIKNVSNFLVVSNNSSSGYIDNTDFETTNLFYQAGLNSKAGDFMLQAGYSNKSFGANSFYTPKYPNQFEHTKTKFINLQMSTGDKIKFTPSVYWRRNHDRFELFRDNPASWYSGHNYHLTDVYGIDLKTSIVSKIGKTSMGAELRSENIWSNVLGDPMDKPISVPGEGDAEFTKSKSRTNISYFLEHAVFMKKLSVSTGILANWNFDLDWQIYPGIDISYEISKKFKFFGSVNQSVRMPTYTDLYYVGPTNKGNPNLKPEKATSYELGLKLYSKALSGHIAAFRRYGSDLIDWVRIADSLKWESQNITEVITNGIEMSVNLNMRKILKNQKLIKYIVVTYSWLHMEKSSGNYISNYVLDNLKHKLSLSLDHKIYKNINASWRSSLQDRNGTYTDFISGNEVDYEAFVMADVRIYWKNRFLKIYIEASNLFDVEYHDMGNIEMPGRWIRCGLSAKIKLQK